MVPVPIFLRLRAVLPYAEVDPGNRLTADYLTGKGVARQFFPCAPEMFEDTTALGRDTHASSRISSPLASYQTHLGADPAAVNAARRLGEPGVAVVTVGQQPELLTGPLYTPLKVLTAVALAKRLERETGRPTVPVYWMGADDDDVAEADHCMLWNAAGNAVPLRLPDTGVPPGTLIGDLPLGEGAASVVTAATAALHGLPHADETIALLQEALADSADFGEWHARLLARLFSPLGLVIVDPRLPALRALVAPILRRELERPLHTTQLVNARAEELSHLGYSPALTKPPNVCNVFLLANGRQRITFRDGCFHAGGKKYSSQELLSSFILHPSSFIPNAVLRPVCQEYLFNSAAFVAGPNEIAYWAELAPVFATLKVPMPSVVLRTGATFIPRRAVRFLNENVLQPLDLLRAPDAARRALLERTQPERVTQSLTAARSAVHELTRDIADAVTSVDATLAPAAGAAGHGMLEELDRLERKVLKALERRDSAFAERFTWMCETLFPGGGLQERTLNLFAIYARLGPRLIPDLLSLLEQQEGRHLFVEL